MNVQSSPNPPTAAETRRPCANCGAELLGEHCYACGQPTKGLVRHFSSIIGDFMDSVFELDSRILRTLGPLLFKPGYLSLEYFAGRRVRYVSPVRLFVFLSLFAFFAAQLRFDAAFDDGQAAAGQVVTVAGDQAGGTPAGGGADSDADASADPDATTGEAAAPGDDRQLASMRQAITVAEVERLRDLALAEINEARAEKTGVPGVDFGLDISMDVAEEAVKGEAANRIREIEGALAAGKPVTVGPAIAMNDAMSFNGKPWHPTENPLVIDWLGDTGNAWVNTQIGRAEDNVERIKEDPNLLKNAFLSMVPTTLFVLLPLFAVLLKIMYFFKKRLYMEHLIVALHSHSFLCGGLLIVVILDALSEWTSAWAWLSRPLGWLEIALLCWMPVYLLLMQKRVYGQGWIMTILKYWVLGTCYLVLISFGATFALLASLVNM
ncbi:hypothetical protein GCM10011521_17140 [Arenimonas soli]|uniref:DUF3667 domain-containing protein n=1 Tax=Arenimonas soli TaxID=2269504 RepID=A0ABQ1HJI7_9GAMM|nr:DUF3667 domain-containing protein [Arenimonas soli]GGA79452.1 hypothetical protein GCM10011521_17140 [Arenimonas soli]